MLNCVEVFKECWLICVKQVSVWYFFSVDAKLSLKSTSRGEYQPNTQRRSKLHNPVPYVIMIRSRDYHFRLLVLVAVHHVAEANMHAKKLFNDVMVRSGYNSRIRPVLNKSDVVRVDIGASLSQLIDVVRDEGQSQQAHWLGKRLSQFQQAHWLSKRWRPIPTSSLTW